MLSRQKVAALSAEFLGTGVLAFVVLTVSRSQLGYTYFVSFAAGLAVVLFGLALQRDVHLNPALTLGLWTARRVKTVKALAFIVAQLLGGLAAYSLFKYFSRGVVQDLPTAYDGRILVAEAVGTFVFAFVAAAALYQKLERPVRAVVTGVGYILGMQVAAAASFAFINPAVSVANNTWAWTTYILGPILGAIIGVNLYALLFAPQNRAVAMAPAESMDDEETESKTAKKAKKAKK